MTELAAPGVDDRDHADPEVPGALGLGSDRPPHSASTRNTGCGLQVERSSSTHDPAEHARQVGGDAAAGDVAQRVHGVRQIIEQPQQLPGVEPGRLEQRYADRAAELVGVIGSRCRAWPGCCAPARSRCCAARLTRSRPPRHRAARARGRAPHPPRPHRPRRPPRRSRRAHQAGVLRRLAADERRAGRRSPGPRPGSRPAGQHTGGADDRLQHDRGDGVRSLVAHRLVEVREGAGALLGLGGGVEARAVQVRPPEADHSGGPGVGGRAARIPVRLMAAAVAPWYER